LYCLWDGVEEAIRGDRQAGEWLLSKYHGVGSFKWICDHTGMDYKLIRRGLARNWRRLAETPQAKTRRMIKGKFKTYKGRKPKVAA